MQRAVFRCREEPCGRDRRVSEIEYLFSVSFPLAPLESSFLTGLVGNPYDCSGSQERFWTSQNDRKKEYSSAQVFSSLQIILM